MNIEVKVTDGISGDWRVESFTVSEDESRLTAIRSFQHPEEFVPPGQYKRLMRRGAVVMSNTPMEYRTHLPIIYRAKGEVLLNGLGLGMVLTAILRKPEVSHVTVVEISLDVIRLVAPHFKSDRVTVIESDAFKFNPNGTRFDAVWHDIWDDICPDNLPEMTKLKRKYGRKCDWQGCWSEDILKYRR